MAMAPHSTFHTCITIAWRVDLRYGMEVSLRRLSRLLEARELARNRVFGSFSSSSSALHTHWRYSSASSRREAHSVLACLMRIFVSRYVSKEVAPMWGPCTPRRPKHLKICVRPMGEGPLLIIVPFCGRNGAIESLRSPKGTFAPREGSGTVLHQSTQVENSKHSVE